MIYFYIRYIILCFKWDIIAHKLLYKLSWLGICPEKHRKVAEYSSRLYLFIYIAYEKDIFISSIFKISKRNRRL